MRLLRATAFRPVRAVHSSARMEATCGLDAIVGQLSADLVSLSSATKFMARRQILDCRGTSTILGRAKFRRNAPMLLRACRQASLANFTVRVYEAEVVQQGYGLEKLQVMAMVGCESVVR